MYLQAVKVVLSVRLLDVDEVSGSMGSNVKTEHHVIWKTRKVYACPRGIGKHRGNSDACGRTCRNARGDDDVEYEDEEVPEVLEVRKMTVLDPKMCVEQR